jgi:hypothetical protein
MASLVRLQEQRDTLLSREMQKFGLTLCEYGIWQFIDRMSLTPLISVRVRRANPSPPPPPGPVWKLKDTALYCM